MNNSEKFLHLFTKIENWTPSCTGTHMVVVNGKITEDWWWDCPMGYKKEKYWDIYRNNEITHVLDFSNLSNNSLITNAEIDNEAKMNINKYINWSEIWNEEIDIQTTIDSLDIEKDKEQIFLLNNFKSETNLELIADECFIQNDKLYFFFGETGGQNESDTNGWSREYSIVIDKDFIITTLEYSQG